jgi:hypothetical protein
MAAHIPAVRTKCDCNRGPLTRAASSMQSACKRRHSNARFRELSDITAHLHNSRRYCRTASQALSVAYATDEDHGKTMKSNGLGKFAVRKSVNFVQKRRYPAGCDARDSVWNNGVSFRA